MVSTAFSSKQSTCQSSTFWENLSTLLFSRSFSSPGSRSLTLSQECIFNSFLILANSLSTPSLCQGSFSVVPRMKTNTLGVRWPLSQSRNFISFTSDSFLLAPFSQGHCLTARKLSIILLRNNCKREIWQIRREMLCKMNCTTEVHVFLHCSLGKES